MGAPVTLTLAVPSSKSVTHRALLLAALSSCPCRVEAPLLGADCLSTLSALEALGARIFRDGDDLCFSPIADLRPPQQPLDCGNSGTSLRLLAGQVARLHQPVRLSGDASLRARPNGPLLDALETLGARCQSTGGRAPLEILGPIQPGTLHLGPQLSSQYASSLLLALALLPGPSRLHLQAPIASRPYLDLTEDIARAFGLHWTRREDATGLRLEIPGGQRPRRARYRVDGDWSGAAFPLVAAMLTGQPLRLSGLDPEALQGDRAILPILERFGARLSWQNGLLCFIPGPMQAPGRIDLGATPDLFPALCALAAVAPGPTELSGAPSLRHKECDRITAMALGLGQLGLPVHELADGLRFVGSGQPRAGAVNSFDDHRIYMAFRILGLRAQGPMAVSGAGCEAVSYPAFEAQLRKLAENSPLPG